MHLLWSETICLLEELIILIWILLNFFLSTKTHEWNARPLAFILALPLIHGPFTALWWQNGGHDHQMANRGEGLRWEGCGLVSWPTWSPHSWVQEFVALTGYRRGLFRCKIWRLYTLSTWLLCGLNAEFSMTPASPQAFLLGSENINNIYSIWGAIPVRRLESVPFSSLNAFLRTELLSPL